MGASVGVAVDRDAGVDADVMFAEADAAVYRAKAHGRGRVELFDEVGRIEYPEYADVGLMEDLDTDRIPPAERARDGVLDM